MKSFLMLCVIAAGLMLVGCGEGEPFENCCGEGSTDDSTIDEVVPSTACSGAKQHTCTNGQSCQFGDDCLFGSNCLNNVCVQPGGNINNPPAGNNQPSRSFSAAGDSSLGFAVGTDLDRTTSPGRVCAVGGWTNQNTGQATLTAPAGTVVQVIACRRNNPSDCNPSPSSPALNLSYWAINPLDRAGCRVEYDCRGSPQILCY